MNDDDLTARGLVHGDDGRIRPEWACSSELLRDYYDHEWGRAVTDERGLFERICLEGFQAGLSWETILRKRPAFREAFAGFDPDVLADWGDAEVDRLLECDGIIRNRAKITAVLTNARATVALRREGGLPGLVLSLTPERWTRPDSAAVQATTSPESTALAKALKKAGFSFVGPTTCFALMEAVGMVDNRISGASGLVGG
ncbi:DNA-3-methyladenine glycosylase I [Corynebacterium sp. P7202]|uniref:DNA-3-methyladenine glycosylase I n=1 Tax=Corynebacterium pygosceleis TaxID=2800406 RepID=A0A9Q4C7I8_9CORY|nr:DNA-3-methyladenine glycosylase I [Corynebacterium pygosceleis]MCK7637283.1 DNA-3-methyladenine glycosylase I [Corynebacterium pygosceleis]MCX7468389.1 DNA-3-methyladenine glycosylase I [Corynebacterium pygosceleis]